MTKDLTRGNPVRVILGFAIPIFLGLLLQQVYNMVDTMIVGKFIGLDALGGIGSTGSLNFLILGFCIGLGSGCGIPMANAFGAGDLKQLRRYIANSIYLCSLFSVVIMTVVLIFCEDFLTITNTTPENYPYAYGYIYWIFWGIPFVMLYNITSAIIRAVGDSKSPLLFLAIAAVTNVILDLLFIVVFDFGVAGAAWATNLSQGLSGTLCLFYIRRKLPMLRFHPGELLWNTKDILHLLSNGLPMALQYFITAIGCVMLQASINALGSAYVNAMAAGNKINQVLCCAIDALGTTMATYCGQNVGARKIERIQTGLRVAIVYSFVFCAVYLLVAWFLSPSISLLFLDAEQVEIIRLVRTMLMIIGVNAWAAGFVNGFRFSIQGMGYSTLAILAGVLEMIARILVAVVLVPHFGFTGACWGDPAAWYAADLFLVPTAYWCLRRLRQRFHAATESV